MVELESKGSLVKVVTDIGILKHFMSENGFVHHSCIVSEIKANK